MFQTKNVSSYFGQRFQFQNLSYQFSVKNNFKLILLYILSHFLPVFHSFAPNFYGNVLIIV